jgi:hypothetical protein
MFSCLYFMGRRPVISTHRNVAGMSASRRCKMTTAIPENPNAWLRRKTTAEALVEAGFPVSEKTLATKAVRGGGPPYQTFGRIALYRWANTLAWAEGELAAPRSRSAATEARRELEAASGDSSPKAA